MLPRWQLIALQEVTKLMALYRLPDGETFAVGTPRWEDLLKRAYSQRLRPLCLCRPTAQAPSMYVAAHRGTYLLKRMPFSGATHAPTCEHYEPPPELSGLAQVAGSAVREDPEQGVTTLALAFSLSTGSSRKQLSGAALEHASVRTDGTKLTLRAVLHFLYDEAGLSRWYPRMLGRRSWSVVRRELLQAANAKRAKGTDLAELLFIPERYLADEHAAIAARRARAMERLAGSTGAKMLLIAPLKDLQQARFGHRMILTHLPDMPVLLNDDVYQRLQTTFAREFDLATAYDSITILVVGTISRAASGLHQLEEAALVTVNPGWLPVEGADEMHLLDALAERAYTKGLRYNMPSSKPMAAAVLHDTQDPVALYIVPEASPPGHEEALQELQGQSQMPSWTWRVAEGAMPELPPVVCAATDATPHAVHDQE